VNVLHVTPSISRKYGGPTYSLAAYSRASLAAGVQNTILSSQADVADDWLTSTLPEVEVHMFRNYGRGALFAVPGLHSWLRRNGEKFDVVHVHGLLNPVSSFAASACVRRGWPLIIRPFGTMSRYTYGHRRTAIKRAYSTLVDVPNLRHASAIHFTTKVERDESAWRGLSWDDRAFVIAPPWIADQARGQRELRRDRRTVLFLSRLHPVKCLDLLLDAWPFVQQSVLNAELLIAGDGDGPYVNEMRARAASIGTSIRMVGHVEGAEKRAVIAQADLFVLPSAHENFGIAVLEAIAAGLPVVVTPEVQLSPFVLEHKLGFVAQRSAQALAASIVRALGDAELNDRCREHGAEIVAECFSLRSVGESLADMYRFAVAHPPA